MVKTWRSDEETGAPPGAKPIGAALTGAAPRKISFACSVVAPRSNHKATSAIAGFNRKTLATTL